MLEGLTLAIVGHHIAVSHRTVHRYAVAAAGQDIGGADEAGEVAGTGGDQASVNAMAAAQTEIDEAAARSGNHTAGGFARD